MKRSLNVLHDDILKKIVNKYGFKISHIDKMSSEQMEEKIMALNQLDAQKERVVNALIKVNLIIKVLNL